MRLEAQIAKDMEAYQKRPKRRFIGARAEEYRFARYVEDWRSNYQVQSLRSSLTSGRITCIDGAILSYGLLDLLPGCQRRLLAIHRRDPKKDEECGHCVALYWTKDGHIGALSKSSSASAYVASCRHSNACGS